MDLCVLIVDDHRSFAECLAFVVDAQLDLRCVGVETSVEGALDRLDAVRTDVVVLSAGRDPASAVKGAQMLREQRGVGVVVVVEEVHVDLVDDVTAAGAVGLASKRSSFEHLLAAIRSSPSGQLLVDGPTVQLLLEGARVEPDDHSEVAELPAIRTGTGSIVAEQLTARENDVLQLLGEGLDPQQIAQELIMSVHTSRGHVKRVMMKLGAHTQLQAVVFAAHGGLLPQLVARSA